MYVVESERNMDAYTRLLEAGTSYSWSDRYWVAFGLLADISCRLLPSHNCVLSNLSISREHVPTVPLPVGDHLT